MPLRVRTDLWTVRTFGPLPSTTYRDSSQMVISRGSPTSGRGCPVSLYLVRDVDAELDTEPDEDLHRCRAGWLEDDYLGRPRPCLVCRPWLAPNGPWPPRLGRPA